MFLTRNYICFYSNILNHANILIVKFSHINSITKSMHAVIFPTAIRIETHNGVYSFTSFRSRSHTLDHLVELLQQSRQVKFLNHSANNYLTKELFKSFYSILYIYSDKWNKKAYDKRVESCFR